MSVKRCDSCGGRGKVTDYSGMGTGSLSCSSCNGTGQVLSFANDAPSDTGGTSGAFEGVSGTTYFVLILIFVGFCVGGVKWLTDYFYVQFANDDYLLYGAAAVSFIVGILIRNILAMIAGVLAIGAMLFVIAAVINGFIQFQAKDKESKNNPVSPAKPSIQELVKDTQSSATVPDEYKCVLCSPYAAEELSASQRESCIKKGCSFSKTPSRPIRARPE